MRAFFKLSAPRLFAVLMVALACLYVSTPTGWPTEPQGCALCGDCTHMYPCLLKLDTGQVGEIYLEDWGREYLEDNWQFRETGTHTTFSFLVGCTVMVSSDAEKSTAEVLVDREPLSFAPELYCRACLKKIEAAELTGGYALADLYDPGGISVYPITEGTEYDIRGYEVMVSSAGDDLYVTVNGYYK